MIKIGLLGISGSSTHMITVESRLSIDVAHDKVTFDYWIWGQPIKTLSTTWTAYRANFLDAIVATS